MTSTSIIIPVYNDPPGIADTLDSVLGNTTSDPEILVVDNCSTDHTPEVISEYSDIYERVHLLHERDIQGSYAARNTGIEHATGDVIVFLDADQTVTEGWLGTALNELSARNADYLAPDVHLVPPADPSLASRYDSATAFPTGAYVKKQQFAPTACLFVTKELLEDVGIFDPRFVSGGDKEFGNRVANAGYKLHYTPAVVVYHPTRNSLSALRKKDFRVGRGIAQQQRFYPDRYGRPGFPPRPSGARSVDSGSAERDCEASTSGMEDCEVCERMVLDALAKALTGTRAAGYLYEAARTGFRTEPSTPPQLD